MCVCLSSTTSHSQKREILSVGFVLHKQSSLSFSYSYLFCRFSRFNVAIISVPCSRCNPFSRIMKFFMDFGRFLKNLPYFPVFPRNALCLHIKSTPSGKFFLWRCPDSNLIILCLLPVLRERNAIALPENTGKIIHIPVTQLRADFIYLLVGVLEQILCAQHLDIRNIAAI